MSAIGDSSKTPVKGWKSKLVHRVRQLFQPTRRTTPVSLTPFRYHPLIDKDEIRVLVLLPGSGRDSLRGRMRHIRVPRVPTEESGEETPDPDQVWTWSFESVKGRNMTTHVARCLTRLICSRSATSPSVGRSSGRPLHYACQRSAYAAHVAQYDALSYTWGGQEKTLQIDLEDDNGDGGGDGGDDDVGYFLPVTPNLFAALSAFRAPREERVIWADSICINQDDTAEKNLQVAMMHDIYSQASSVVVWLGEDTDSDVATVRNLVLPFRRRYWETGYEFEPSLVSEFSTESLARFCRLLNRPWWRRVWIIQEVVAAREVVFFFPEGITIPWSFVDHLCRDLKLKDEKTYENFSTLAGFRKQRGSLSLISLLHSTYYFGASNPRDRLYALLGIASDVLAPSSTPGAASLVAPDYFKSPEDVYRDLVRFLASSSSPSLDILALGGRPAADGQPTWMPDWRGALDPLLTPLMAWGNSGNLRLRASGETRASVAFEKDSTSILLTDGIIADRVDHVGDTLEFAGGNECAATVRRWYSIAQEKLGPEEARSSFPRAIITTHAAIMISSEPDSPWIERCFDNFMSGVKEPLMKHYVEAVLKIGMKRRFFVTRAGRMGLGPANTRLGDRVVVVQGCSVPLVMRKADDDGGHMVLVGEAHVSGLMAGEVMQEVDQGKYVVETIRLK